jgi:hypothetical protein
MKRKKKEKQPPGIDRQRSQLEQLQSHLLPLEQVKIFTSNFFLVLDNVMGV